MPDLDWVLLPPYDIPNVIVVSGLLVENRTTRPVQNVRIHIEYDPSASLIHHMQVVADDEYILRGGGETHAFATLGLRQMSPHTRVVVYFAASRPVNPVVSVTTWRGQAA